MQLLRAARFCVVAENRSGIGGLMGSNTADPGGNYNLAL